MSPQKVLILTHGDSDGVCAAAIAKAVYPQAKVEFTIAGELPRKLREISGYELVFILDLRPNKEQKDEVREALKRLAKTSKVVHIDHHPFPRGVTRKDLPCEIIHRTNVSTSELALEYFNPPASLEYIALLGAIGDYQEHTRRMRELLMKYGARRCYTEAVTHLDQVLRIVDDEFKRRMVEELAQGKWPHEVPLGKELASKVLRQQRVIEGHIRREARSICKHVIFVGGVPYRACGYGAELVVELLRAEVGLAGYKVDGKIRLSARRRWGSTVRLNTLMEECASAVGGVGGGHVGAAGGMIPSQGLNKFLSLVRHKLCTPQ